MFPHEDAAWVLHGLESGFDIGCSDGFPSPARRNCRSAYLKPEIIDDYLEEELSFGSIAGLFKSSPIKNLQINRFGVIPKSTPGKWRLITDLSYPMGHSVNSLIPDELAEVQYKGIPDSIKKIMFVGRGALMAKFDIKRAYRLLPVSSNSRKFLGMLWRGHYYIDLAIPFGLRSAPRIFTRFADILEHIFVHAGQVRYIQHYLDDFFIIGRPDSDECQVALTKCMALSAELGVPLAEQKTEGPTTKLSFLGFILDSVNLEILLPEQKIEKIKVELKVWYTKKSGTKRQLLSLIGRLQHCCQAIELGRPFIRRLIDRASKVHALDHFVALSAWEIDDIFWWEKLFKNWNGRSLFLLPDFEIQPDNIVTSDAAGSIGMAAIYGDAWFACKWPKGVEQLNIAVKELIPIVLAAKIWGGGGSWLRHRVLFRCDNMAVVECLKKRSCKDRHLSYLLRELSLAAILHSFTFTAVHIPGIMNREADALSRFEFQAFFNAAPTANRAPERIQVEILKCLLFPPWIKLGKIC
eukprot:Seg2871.1 transcript_id=Seg2871.1/GoldUCD/mRNA.D3Y31 product="Polyprotein P3" protein_id=Seg2871.1/GoldUCD/D3Y31